MDKRVHGVISWDEMFMQFAEIAARRSKDPRTQVGACIASHDNRVLSIGYNGAPAGFDDDLFPWGRDPLRPLESKYPFVVHAEENAVLNFRGARSEMVGSTLYVTHFCCNECAKTVVQAGIKEIVYMDAYVMPNGLTPAALTILKYGGVSHRQLIRDNRNEHRTL